MTTIYAVFDIGGTNVKYAAFSEEATILEKGSFPTPVTDGMKMCTKIKALVSDWQKRYRVLGIGLSLPGLILDGKIRSGNIIAGMNGFDIQGYFEEAFGLPVAAENDANCAALAEACFGNGRGSRRLAVVTLGTGVGGGLVLDGKLYTGHLGLGGEFGFMFIGPVGEDIDAATLSAQGSTRALTEKASKVYGHKMDGREIFRLAENPKEPAAVILSNWYDALAIGLHNLSFVMGPDTILIGGAVSAQPALIDEIRLRLNRLHVPISENLSEIIRIERCALLNDAGLYGALALIQKVEH